jgi:hypothetical protein
MRAPLSGAEIGLRAVTPVLSALPRAKPSISKYLKYLASCLVGPVF